MCSTKTQVIRVRTAHAQVTRVRTAHAEGIISSIQTNQYLQ